MTLLQFFGYLSDVWVLGAYFWFVHSGKHQLLFHWANALGAAPVLIAEVQLGAWQVLPLTATFCVVGWYGIAKWYIGLVRADTQRRRDDVRKMLTRSWVHTDDIGDR